MNYYSKISAFILVIALSLFGCSKDSEEDVTPTLEPDEFFIEMQIDGSPYKKEFTSDDKEDYSVTKSGYLSCQNQQVAKGFQGIFIADKEEVDKGRFSINIELQQPIKLTKLNRDDDSDYAIQMLNAEQFEYPENDDGIPGYVDEETNEVVLEKEGVGEVFFSMTSNYQNYDTYQSGHFNFADPSEQPETSYFIIDKVTKKEIIGDGEWDDYQFIIEGRFACQVYRGGDLNADTQFTKQITSGSFRLPYKQVNTSTLFGICKN